MFSLLLTLAFLLVLATVLEFVWELLGNCWGTFGEHVVNCWGIVGELLGNFWETFSELFKHFFGTTLELLWGSLWGGVGGKKVIETF